MSSGESVTNEQLAGMIDHTILKADAVRDEIIRVCEEAKQYHFATVCVNPGWVSAAAEVLKSSKVGITTVVGFPLGATSTASKADEARHAIADGATEIDMVLNIGLLKSGEMTAVQQDVEAVVAACKGKAAVKVILETGMLTDEEKETACKLCVAAGADFVKTSTGFGKGGATVEDIALMRRAVGPDMGVKASGGVRDRETALQLVAAGATRIGASSGIAIVTGGTGSSSY